LGTSLADEDGVLEARPGILCLEVIATELAKRGQPASVIEKVLGANFQRVIGEIWGTS